MAKRVPADIPHAQSFRHRFDEHPHDRHRPVRLLASFSPGAAAIAECEKIFGAKFPQDYVAFLLFANGGEGFVGDNQPLILWSVERLLSINDG